MTISAPKNCRGRFVPLKSRLFRFVIICFILSLGFPLRPSHGENYPILYLRSDKVKNVTNKRDLITRPFSLADPQTIEMLKGHLKKNITTTMKGLVLAYAFDDEISLGRFTTPADVDRHPYSIAWFRR